MLSESMMGSALASSNLQEIPEAQLLQFRAAIQKLQNHEPVQYIIGEAHFYGLIFKVDSNVLIPRPETEELVHLIIKNHQNKPMKILDIGTGSGCIPVSLKKHLPLAVLSALDISGGALEVAKANAGINEVDVTFFQDDALNLDTDKHQLYDVIVSNPPYVALSGKAQMGENVINHEPHLALFVPDEHPLLFYDKISDFALTNLKKTGSLYLEINQTLGEDTASLLENKGFRAEIIKDINNNERIISAQFLG